MNEVKKAFACALCGGPLERLGVMDYWCGGCGLLAQGRERGGYQLVIPRWALALGWVLRPARRFKLWLARARS